MKQLSSFGYWEAKTLEACNLSPDSLITRTKTTINKNLNAQHLILQIRFDVQDTKFTAQQLTSTLLAELLEQVKWFIIVPLVLRL